MADLGFNVDTGGMDKAQAALDKTTQSAAKTEQQANKTSAALSNIGSSDAGAAIGKTAQSADQLAASLVKASTAAQQHLNVAQALETIVTKTGVSYAAANTALTAAVAANANAATAAGNHASELGKVAQAAAAVAPKLTEAGASAGILGRELGSLGGGGGGGGSIGSIAAGFGGLLGPLAAAGAGFIALSVAVAKSSDQLKATEKELQLIYGSTQKGTEALNSIRESAKEVGMQYNSLEGYIEGARQGLDKMSTSWPVLFGSASQQITNDGNKLREMFVTLKKDMDNSSVSIAKENEVLATLTQSIQKTGGLSADAFSKIASIVPGIATQIARAFNFQNIAEFQKYLESNKVSAQNLETVFGQMRPKIDASFDPSRPQDFEHALEGVKIAWNSALDSLAATGVFDGINRLLGEFGTTIKTTAHEVELLKELFNSSWNDTGVVQTTNDLIAMGKAAASAAAAVVSAVAAAAGSAQAAEAGAMPGAPQSGIQLDQSSASSDIPAFATGGSFTVQGSGGTDSQLIQFHATPGEVVTISGGTGDTGGTTLAPSGHVDTGGSSGDMAVIDAINNGATAIVNAIHGLGGGTSVAGSTQAITSSVNQASGVAGSSASNPFGPGGFTFGNVSLGGLGKALSDQMKNALQQSQQSGGGGSGGYGTIGPARQYGTVANSGAGGVNVPPSLHSGLNFINPSDPFHPFDVPGQGSNTGIFGQEMGHKQDQTTDAVKSTETAVDHTQEAVKASGGDIVSGVASGASSIVSSVASIGAAIVSAIASSASSSSSGGASGGGMGGGAFGGGYSGAGGFSGGGYYSSGGGDYSTGGDYSGGGSYYSGGGGLGSEIGGSGGNFDPYAGGGGGSTGGGFDPGAIDYGGGDPGSGYFATGGEFTVAGSGGTDSQLIQFHATPGEKVTISGGTGAEDNKTAMHTGSDSSEPDHRYGSANGYKLSDAANQWSPGAIPGSSDAGRYWPGGTMSGDYIPTAPPSREQNLGGSNTAGERTVNIVVQAGVQAEQFLRSRAQIARAMG